MCFSLFSQVLASYRLSLQWEVIGFIHLSKSQFKFICGSPKFSGRSRLPRYFRYSAKHIRILLRSSIINSPWSCFPACLWAVVFQNLEGRTWKDRLETERGKFFSFFSFILNKNIWAVLTLLLINISVKLNTNTWKNSNSFKLLPIPYVDQWEFCYVLYNYLFLDGF